MKTWSSLIMNWRRRRKLRSQIKEMKRRLDRLELDLSRANGVVNAPYDDPNRRYKEDFGGEDFLSATGILAHDSAPSRGPTSSERSDARSEMHKLKQLMQELQDEIEEKELEIREVNFGTRI